MLYRNNSMYNKWVYVVTLQLCGVVWKHTQDQSIERDDVRKQRAVKGKKDLSLRRPIGL
jgi:hypothetical protein